MRQMLSSPEDHEALLASDAPEAIYQSPRRKEKRNRVSDSGYMLNRSTRQGTDKVLLKNIQLHNLPQKGTFTKKCGRIRHDRQ